MLGKITYFLIVLNVALFFYSVATFSGADFDLVSLSKANLDAGRYESIVTSGFFHTSLLHLFWNMIFLFLFGRAVEEETGPKILLLIYFSGMILGALAFVFVFPTDSALGASGAIFGLMGYAMLAMPFKPIYDKTPIPISLIGTIYLAGTISNLFNTEDNIANISHFGGAVAGGLIAFWKEKENSLLGLGAMVFFLLLAVAFA